MGRPFEPVQFHYGGTGRPNRQADGWDSWQNQPTYGSYLEGLASSSVSYENGVASVLIRADARVRET